MVDWNNEATIGTPAVDIVRVTILQRRYDLFEALEAYNKLTKQGLAADNHIVSSRLFTLFLELQAGLKRKWKEPEYNDLLNLIVSDDIEDIKQAIYKLNIYLDGLRLTRIDTRQDFDSTRVEYENKIKKL